MASAPDRSGGRLAQLVERFLYTEDVGGSSPSAPTSVTRSHAGGMASMTLLSEAQVTRRAYAALPSSAK